MISISVSSVLMCKVALAFVCVLISTVPVHASSRCNDSSVHWCVHAASLFHAPVSNSSASGSARHAHTSALTVVDANLLGDGDVLTNSCTLLRNSTSIFAASHEAQVSPGMWRAELDHITWRFYAQALLMLPPGAAVSPGAPANAMPMIARSPAVTQLGDRSVCEMVFLGSIEVPVRFRPNTTRAPSPAPVGCDDRIANAAAKAACAEASPLQSPSPIPTVLHLMVGVASVEDICYEISLFASLDDVHTPSRALLHWVSTVDLVSNTSSSSPQSPSCQVRLSAYVEKQLLRTSSSSSATLRSSGLVNCRLATVERFTYPVPEDLLRRAVVPTSNDSAVAVLTLYATVRVLSPQSILTNQSYKYDRSSEGVKTSSVDAAALVKLLAVTVDRDEDNHTTYYYHSSQHNVNATGRRDTDVRTDLQPAQRCATLRLAKDFWNTVDYVTCSTSMTDEGSGYTLLYLLFLACSSILALAISLRILRSHL